MNDQSLLLDVGIVSELDQQHLSTQDANNQSNLTSCYDCCKSV